MARNNKGYTPRTIQSRPGMPRYVRRGNKRLRDEFTLRNVEPTSRESLSAEAHMSPSMQRLEALLAQGGAHLWEALAIAEILTGRSKPGSDKQATASMYLRHLRATLQVKAA